jgi:serine/threonine-protein kinase
MAPEQVAGQEVGPAVDIYALGVVMFEMVTGSWPFVADTAMLTALKRLQEDAPSPRARVPELDPVWEAVILRCLRREPSERFAAAEEVARALAGEGGKAASRARRLRWPRVALIGAGVTAAVVAAGYAVLHRAPPAGAPSAVRAPAASPPPVEAAAPHQPEPRATQPEPRATQPAAPAQPVTRPKPKRARTPTDPLITDYPE